MLTFASELYDSLRAVLADCGADDDTISVALVPIVRRLCEGRGRIIEAALASMGAPLTAAGPWVACAAGSLPEDGVVVLAHGGYPVSSFLAWQRDGSWNVYMSTAVPVTHWAPIYAPVVAPVAP